MGSRINIISVTGDGRFSCQSLSTIKLGFLGLLEAQKKPRMVRFIRNSADHPFLVI